MTARFAKLRDGKWGVKVDGDATCAPGDQVEITKRDGSTKTVTLGRFLGVNGYGDRGYEIAADEKAPAKDDGLTPITEIGAFEYGGVAYIVKRTKDGERLYAQKVVEINADRINQADDIVQIELEYERGAMAFLREEHRLDAEQAKALSIRYGRCIVCGRKLKAAKSVEAGIGPVCMGRVAARAAA